MDIELKATSNTCIAKQNRIMCKVTLYIIYLFSFTIKFSYGQKHFPPLTNIAQDRPSVTYPSDSTCGIPTRNAYCISSIYKASIDQCVQDFCVQSCPNRTSLPLHTDLLIGVSLGFRECVITDKFNKKPESSLGEFSTYFMKPGPDCYITPSVTPPIYGEGAVTFTVWVWREEDNYGTLVQKQSTNTSAVVYHIQIDSTGVVYTYQTAKGTETITLPEVIPAKTWTHIAIQAYKTIVSFYINGVGPGYSATYTSEVTGPLLDETGTMRVGQDHSGNGQFLGRIQNFFIYSTTLSNREIQEIYTGFLPHLRVQTNCRCPVTHPRVRPDKTHYCIPNNVIDNSGDVILRLNDEAHFLEYINDGDSNSVWLSKFQNKVEISIDLGDIFQVFYVVLQFYSPFSKAVTIERKQNYSSDWTTWQYYADDCQQYFSQPNNGPLLTSTSVNCLQFVQDEIPYSGGQITFKILSPEPVTRPAYNQFYETPELQDFVKASIVKITLEDHYYSNHFRHEYFGMSEITVSGRCDCNGHANDCDTSGMPYTCNCTTDSHTEGSKCERCHPLYNNKGYKLGDQINSFNCKPCECHGHAEICVYDVDLDLFPDNHDLGGGGVCQNCKHNTTGQFCDICVTYYFRPVGKSKYDKDVCSQCDCLVAGVNNVNLDCEKEGGQCYCKSYVESRQCDTCKPGFYNLQATNPDGCDNCSCVTMGTQHGDITCHPTTGVCNCKNNVRNDKCDACKYGYYNLTDTNPLGCTPCDCNPMGATSQFCNPVTGQCPCEDRVVGRKCDVCTSGYYDFFNNCVSCKCDVQGTIPGSICNAVTGQCVCKTNVQGLVCNECADGSFAFGASTDKGCNDCTCDLAGTINSTSSCDKFSGNCHCKENVEGMSCNQCKGNTFGLNVTDPEGCQSCKCDPTGTQSGDNSTDLACDQNTGQCACLAKRFGRTCDDCEQDYYINPTPGGGCNPCGCDNTGTLPLTHCDSMTGQCYCKQQGSGVTGRACNECFEKFYNFNKKIGNCSRCDCYEPGSKSEFCDLVSGQCECKDFVTSRRCDTCVTGSSHLNADNPYGCSKIPAQQPPPLHTQLSSGALHLYWYEPDYTNGVINSYRLFRNATLVFIGNGSDMEFNDTSLLAYTKYTYVIEATNDFGSIYSPAVTFQTLPGTPVGIVLINIMSVTVNTAILSWNQPVNINGPLSSYSIQSETIGSNNRTVHWTGMTKSAEIIDLVPFTNYTVFVITCTPGGCHESWPTSFFTKSAPPSGMAAPLIDIVSYSELNITWVPPRKANGIIIYYELWMRGEKKSDGNYDPIPTRIFHPGGQYNPRPTLSPQENTLPPPDTGYIMSGLEPFTWYEFQVLAENNKGKTASPWVGSKTGEAVPLEMSTPKVLPHSSTAVTINWTAPSENKARGMVQSYGVFFFEPTNETAFPFAPPFMWKLLVTTDPNITTHTLHQLEPYTNYTFKVQVCNHVGCINSTGSYGSTLQAIPEGFSKPQIDSLSSTVIRITWSPPLLLNGPQPVYSVQKTETSLSFPANVIQGTRFPGGGYYKFPASIIPFNVGFTGIRFWFRTKTTDSLLMFAGSVGNQDEFIALQFKSGRPWFLFDPQGCTSYVEIDPLMDDDRTYNDNEWHFLRVMRDNEYSLIQIDNKYQGCSSFVTPTNDEGLPYNDQEWHFLEAKREGKIASISIDVKWTGVRENTCATGTIIGPTSGLYIGGVPKDFVRRVGGPDSRKQVLEKSFQGCIKNVEILQQLYPVEVWEPLDWTQAETFELAFANWQGCPTNLDSGAHFMGQGYLTLLWNRLEVKDVIGLHLTMRTDMKTGLLFFTYGGPGIYFYLGMINGALHMQFSNNVATGSVTFSRSDISLCDGYWHTIAVKKTNQQAEIEINSITVSNGDSTFSLKVETVSPVFIGGIPDNSEATQFVKDNGLTLPFGGFGGCLRDVRVQNYIPFFYPVYLNFVVSAVTISNVNLDGCSPFQIPSRTCREDILDYIYNGTEYSYEDKNLTPYSDYLYRVYANNQAGHGISTWSYGRTLEGAPKGLSAPYDVVVVTGYVITAKWKQPDLISGLLQKYVLRAHNIEHPDSPPVEAEYDDKTFQGQISNAIPNTNYSVKIMACTGGGCTESTDDVIVFSNQEAPEDVPAPTALADIDSMTVMWKDPGKPNGLITGYFLYKDAELIYTGGERMFNISDLQVYTSYQFSIRACTIVGCTNSPVAALSTSQLPPSFMKTPQLTVLGTTEIEVRWEEPQQLNGVLERYVIYVSQFPVVNGHVVYNNSDFFTDFIISELLPGTVYYITVAACTGGGCTLSSKSTIRTEESSPEGVKEPTIISLSYSELNVTWNRPLRPNGHITAYFLYHNEVLIYQGLLFSHLLSGLEPFSLHTFRVVACTVKGCGSSRLINGRTLEAKPNGFVVMEAKIHDSRTINVKWTPPDTPNGLIHYNIFLNGLFYKDPDNWDHSTIEDRKSVYNSTVSNQWIQISPVIPMSTYSVQVNASNTAGYILSNTLQLDMPEGSPDGVEPPTVLSQTSTSVTATWASVGRQNAKDAPVYVIQFRDRNNSTMVKDIFGPTTSYIYTKQQLQPYMEYDFRIKATNSQGSTYSPWVMIVTLQDKPIGLDPPMIVDMGTRSVNLTWQAPLISNGYIAEYKIYVNGILAKSATFDEMPLTIEDLAPFELYSFIVEACTSGGCTNSSLSNIIRTLPDLPEEFSMPTLTSLTPTSVLITWLEPVHPNGLISEYIIERYSPETKSNPVVITQILPSTDLAYVDESVELSPFTTYNYRIMVRNDAGASFTPWSAVTTMSAKPSELLPPAVQKMSPTSLEMTWQPPRKPNGILEYYMIRLPYPSVEIRNTSLQTVVIEDLFPYTQYFITLTACTDAGCTESTVVVVRTDATVPDEQDPPLPIVVSQTIISIAWSSPSRDNGPNIRYELSRMKLRQPLEVSATNFDIWQSLYLGPSTLFEDTGLPLFTTFVYRVTVYNDVGQLTSNNSREVTTYGGFPRKAAEVTVFPVDHTTIEVKWITPDVIDLQGSVKEFIVKAYSIVGNFTQHHSANVDHTLLQNLTPMTRYKVYVTIIIHGGASITSEPQSTITKDGAPDGVSKPLITVLSHTSLRVSWVAPLIPNGQITGYYIHIINNRISTEMTDPGSYIVNDLQPYTVYSVKIEVCTVFDCTESEPVLVTTVEALPQGVLHPSVTSVSPTEVDISWKPPENGNGIILKYELIKQRMKPCSQIAPPTLSPELTKCSYVQCSVFENICGTQCYTGTKVCCEGNLYDLKTGYDCCGPMYIPKPSGDAVCCSGVFYLRKDNYKCCKDSYTEVLPGQVCCPDLYESRLLVGHGDTCCGSVPYSSSGSQVCCQDKLYDGFQRKCCGENLIDELKVCCGDNKQGSSYIYSIGYQCCNTEYVDNTTSLCCTADTGHQKVHIYSDKSSKDNANEKCCGLEKISKTLSCCNHGAYNPETHVCADISQNQIGCGVGNICPIAQSETAYCDRCDFQDSTDKCGAVIGYHGDFKLPPLPDPTKNCVVDEEILYSGMDFSFKDAILQPHSMYQYAVRVVNSAGETTSPFTFIITQEAPPEQVLPPVTNTDSSQLYVILLSWDMPLKPNGDIIRFILTRDGVELYRGMTLQYTDDAAILPYQSYKYVLTACTQAGCTDSPQVTVATAEGKPEGVGSVLASDVTSTAMRLIWSPPTKPNGIVKSYTLFLFSSGSINSYQTLKLQQSFTGLKPYTEYSILLQVCTNGGCTNSSRITVKTLADLPVGVDPPRVVFLSSTSILLFWNSPTQPNGEILFFSIMRLWSKGLSYLFMGMKLETVENGLTRGETYKYYLITGTNAGNTSSTPLSVTMPDQSLPYIPEPKNITVLSATEIYIEWYMVDFTGGVIDQYGVVLDAGRDNEINKGVGNDLSVVITGLKPFTQYEVRVKGCVKGFINRCGLGQPEYIQTSESLPEAMNAPVVVPKGPKLITVSWEPPIKPNGKITQYLIYYRQLGFDNELLINRVLGEVTSVDHAGNDLKPYTQYQYKVVASNRIGDIASPWSTVRTLESVPTNLLQPYVNSSGPFGFQIIWQPPQSPNGVITMYRIAFRKILTDPSAILLTKSVEVKPNVLSTSVSGLEPFANYEVQLTAYNRLGNVSTVPVIVQTHQSSPSGLPKFSVEKIDTGTSLILRWNPPTLTNGIITEYRINEDGSPIPLYQGLNREYEFRRLQPFTEYFVRLVACTLSGCSEGNTQRIITAEVQPTNQPSPTIGFTNSTVVSITWAAPVNPNGKIIMYEIVRQFKIGKKRSFSDPVIVYKTMNTSLDSYTYTDTGLSPFTEFVYSVKASNSKGSVVSSWQSVFTSQEAPEGVHPPTVTHITDDIHSLFIQWTFPERPNGIVKSYNLQRNNSVPLTFTTDDPMEYTDFNLVAYTWYSYKVSVCTTGGCADSYPTVIRTLESAPSQMDPPIITILSSTTLNISWTVPSLSNGIVTKYQLFMDDLEIYNGAMLSFVKPNLIPYREYTFHLSACTSGGCTDSGKVKGRPEDDVPMEMPIPILSVLSSRSIEIRWQTPIYPNGITNSYDVRRDSKLVYTETLSVSGILKTSFIDYDLIPGTLYEYVVIARNNKGSVESFPVSAKTYSASPSGLSPPNLQPLTSTSVQATWQPPAFPNGPIVNYTLYQSNKLVFSGSPIVFTFVVAGLNFWTEYSFRIQACTDKGCELSSESTVRTLESRPEEQGSPIILPLADVNGAHSGVQISWTSPIKPNGYIIYYELHRRMVTQEEIGTSYSGLTLVYNGTQLQYVDTDSRIKPYTEYQYMVISGNRAGKAESFWQTVLTKESAPEFILPPIVDSKTSTTIAVTLTEPTVKNGIIRKYSVIVNNTVISSSIGLHHTIGVNVPLKPNTLYSMKAEACTGGGCTVSQVISVQTTSSIPTGMSPVRVDSTQATSVKLSWTYPTNPNGDIIRFILYQRRTCPLLPQPILNIPCVIGEVKTVFDGLAIQREIIGLTPYTAYDFQVHVENTAGLADGIAWVRAETKSSAPLYVAYPRVNRTGTDLVIDWSESFTLNGRLMEYILVGNRREMFLGINTVFTVKDIPLDKQSEFSLRLVTDYGSVDSPVFVYDPINTGTTTVLSIISTPDNTFYTEIWFIVLVSLIGALLIFTLLACCLRQIGATRPYIRERNPLELSKYPATFDPNEPDDSSQASSGRPFHTKSSISSYGKQKDGITNYSFESGYHEDSSSRSRSSYLDDHSGKMRLSDLFKDDEDKAVWEDYPDNGLFLYDEDSDESTLPGYQFGGDTVL